MGAVKSKINNDRDPIVKEGYPYEKLKDDIKPLDVILFKGSDFISDSIRFAQYIDERNVWTNQYSHAGMIISRDILDDERLEPGKLYIWESTMSGKLGSGIYNIDGKWHLGVQVRSFDDLIIKYDEPNTTAVAWCKLNNNPFINAQGNPEKLATLKEEFKIVFDKYNGIRYDLNPFGLLPSIVGFARPLRKVFEFLLRTKKWLFCSEMIAKVYKDLGILDDSVNEKNVVPVDFITGVDDDNEMPEGLMKLPVKLVTPIHEAGEHILDVDELLHN